MISTERATEIARSIVDARIYINVWGDPTTIDNNLMGGIELAHVVASGYVSQLTISGERRLMEAHKRITALRDAAAKSRPAPDNDLVMCATPDGTWYHLTYSASGMPVRIHTTVRECADSGDETSMLTGDNRFLVTGAAWRDDISEQAPCLVGRWLSDGQGEIETYPMPSEAFHVRWELWR